jgi:ferredoxin
MTVTVTLQQPDGTLIAEFAGEDKISLAQMAKNNSIEFPTSCGIGLCWVCTCKIISGNEHVQIDKISLPKKELARNEDGSFQEFFACVGGIKSESLKDSKEYTIVLEKHL